MRPLRDLSRTERRHRALLRTYHDNLPETQVQTMVKSMRLLGRFWKKLLKVCVWARLCGYARVSRCIELKEITYFKAKKEEAAMKRVREKEATLPVTTDIDARARELLTDLDRAERCNTKMIDSRILHMAYQRFPVEELKEALESNLNRLLIMQIREREKGTRPKEEREDEVDEEELGYVGRCKRAMLLCGLHERPCARALWLTVNWRANPFRPDIARLSHFVGIGRLTLAERRRRKAHNELVKLTAGDKDKEPLVVAEKEAKKPKLLLPSDDSHQMKAMVDKMPEYKPFLDWDAAKKRRDELDEEMELVRSGRNQHVRGFGC